MAKGLALLLRLVLAVVLALPAAQAADLDAKAEAKARFTAGESHYNLNEFSEAFQEFKEAYRLYPDPVFLYNLGQCERQLSHYEEASRFYRSFLRKMPKAPNRAEVERKIEEMEAALKNRPAAERHEDPALPPPVEPALTSGKADATPAPEPAPAAEAGEAVPVATAGETLQEGSGSPEAANQASQPALPPAAALAPSTEGPAGVANLDQAAAPAAAPSIYKRWWFWTAAGAVLAGAATALILYETSGSAGPPQATLGGKKVY